MLEGLACDQYRVGGLGLERKAGAQNEVAIDLGGGQAWGSLEKCLGLWFPDYCSPLSSPSNVVSVNFVEEERSMMGKRENRSCCALEAALVLLRIFPQGISSPLEMSAPNKTVPGHFLSLLLRSRLRWL